MKRIKNWYGRRMFFFLVIALALQTTNAQSPYFNKNLNNFFDKFKQGLQCIIRGKSCGSNEKKKLYAAGFGILAMLAASGALYTQRNRIKRLFAPKKEWDFVPMEGDENITK